MNAIVSDGNDIVSAHLRSVIIGGAALDNALSVDCGLIE